MKKAISIILVLSIFVSMSTSASAALPGTVTPNYVNADYASLQFSVDDDGVATIVVDCFGRSTTTGIDVTVYLERRIAGGWIRVNIDTGTNTWVRSVTGHSLLEEITYRILTYGEYRVTAVFTVYGNVSDDVITLRQTATHPN